jgi:uncharacterized protein YjlB
MSSQTPLIKEFLIKGNERFPNSSLPVLLYKRVLNLPSSRAASAVEKLFEENGWTNNWRNGIYTYHHYHSNTHEAFACVKGSTTLLLGGENGKRIRFEAGDVIIVPAGVAPKNLGGEDDVCCVGGYPEGRDFDMNYGNEGERPQADQNIAEVPLPVADPVYGTNENGLVYAWKQLASEWYHQFAN